MTKIKEFRLSDVKEYIPSDFLAVYRIRNNDCYWYIGLSKNTQSRLIKHANSPEYKGKDDQTNYLLKESIRKYGANNHYVSVMQVGNYTDAEYLELLTIYLIKGFFGEDKLFNINYDQSYNKDNVYRIADIIRLRLKYYPHEKHIYQSTLESIQKINVNAMREHFLQFGVNNIEKITNIWVSRYTLMFMRT